MTSQQVLFSQQPKDIQFTLKQDQGWALYRHHFIIVTGDYLLISSYILDSYTVMWYKGYFLVLKAVFSKVMSVSPDWFTCSNTSL